MNSKVLTFSVIFGAFFFLATLASKAQPFPLEHAYPFMAGEHKLNVFQLSATETVYAQWDQSSRTLYVYDASHNLTKAIVADVQEPIYGQLVSVTRKVFNTDDSIEFLITGFGYYIIKESGAVLHSERLASGNVVSLINTSTGAKMVVNRSYYDSANAKPAAKYEVYALPGALPTGKKESVSKPSQKPAFPNPSGTYIMIPNEEKGNQFTVFNLSGEQLDERIISGTYTFDTTDLPPGIYIYRIDGKYSGKFVKE